MHNQAIPDELVFVRQQAPSQTVVKPQGCAVSTRSYCRRRPSRLITPEGSRKELAKDPAFIQAFNDAEIRFRRMDYRFVEEAESTDKPCWKFTAQFPWRRATMIFEHTDRSSSEPNPEGFNRLSA